MPKTRVDFWQEKFKTNIARDERCRKALIERGWTVLTIWECQTGSVAAVEEMVRSAI